MMKRLFQNLLTMSRLLFVVLIVASTFVFAMFQGGIVSWTIFYATLPFAFYSLLLFFYPLTSISAERFVNKTSVQQGDRVEVEVVLTRKIPYPLLYMVIQDEWRSGEALGDVRKNQMLFLVGWKKTVRWTYEMEHLTRGEYVANQLTVKIIDFFGWIKKERIIPVHHMLLVYPKIEKIHFISLGTRYGGEVVGSPLQLFKDTNVVTSVRNYEEGDRMSWIHWKSFARTETLMTKEFDDVGSETLQLIFDNRYTSNFEAQVIFAASILQEAKKERLTIQFSPIHQELPFMANQSKVQFQKSLQYLAKVQPEHVDEIIPTLSFEKVLNGGGVVAVVTSKLDCHLRKVIERYVVNHRFVIFFLIIESDDAITASMKGEIHEAKAKGVQVQVLRNDQFTDSFKEVVHNERQ